MNDLYFEAHTTTDKGERYIRAHMYVCDYFGDAVEDAEEVGYFNLDFEEPYDYEWPTELVAYIAELVGSESTIPALAGATRVELAQTEDYQYLIISYENTQAQFDAYLELLGSTYTVTDGEDELEVFKIAIPTLNDDLELWLGFDADEGAIYIYVNKHLPHLDAFPQDQVKAANGGIDIPVPTGASYYTYEEQVEYYEDEDTGEEVAVVVDAIVTLYGISSAEMTAYLNDGFDVGNWKVNLIGVDDLDNPTIGYYIAQLFKNDNTYYEFLMNYDLVEEVLVMDIYPMEGYNFSTSYPTAIINAFLTANELGSVPSFETAGITHYIYQQDENYVWVFAQGDYEEAWLDILEDAGYTIPEQATDYGYECRSVDGTIEIDIQYNENYDQTGFTIYSTEYLDGGIDWDDIDWDSLLD